MKKLVLGAAAALAGWLAWSKIRQEREDRALWADVTDQFGETPDSLNP